MVINPETGALRWNPTEEQIGEHTVAVRLTDANGAFVGQEFTLYVNGTNTPPQIVSTAITRAAVNQDYSYQIVATDPENDNLTYSLGNSPDGMTVSDNGLITWTPEENQLEDVDVSVFVTDAQGATSNQSFTIEIATQEVNGEVVPVAINNAPEIVSNPVYIAELGGSYEYQVVANDPDVGDTLTYQLLSVPDNVTGMSIDSTTGLLTWDNPVAGTYQIAVGAVDSQGLGAAQGFTLTARANNAPVINSTPGNIVNAGSTYSYDVRAVDVDGDVLSYTLDQASLDKGISIDELGRLRWKTTVADTNHSARVTVADGNGGSTEQEVQINVVGDTEAPKVRLIAGFNFINQGESVTFQARATDNVGVAGLQLLINDNPVVIDGNGLFTVENAVAGKLEGVAIATDAAGNTGQATFDVDVVDTSDTNAPTVSFSLDVPEDGIVTAPTDIIGTISDDGDIDYYTVEVAPVAGGEFKEILRVDNPDAVTDGVLGKFDPSLLQNDSYRVRLSVYDTGGNGTFAEEVVDVAGELKLGNFRLSFTDLEVPVTGIPITLTRTYDTLTSNNTDDFGYGWRMEFRDTDLRTSLGKPSEEDELLGRKPAFKDDTRVYITLPGGKREGFTFKPSIDPISGFLRGAAAGTNADPNIYRPEFEADDGVTSTLTVKDERIIRNNGTSEFFGISGSGYNPADSLFGGTYILTTKEGIEYEIDGVSGDLLSVTDTNGNTLTYTDEAVTSSTGQKITFERDAEGRITSVKDPSGELIRYEYDDNGDLVSVTDREENVTRMEYNPEREHYLGKIIDPLGRTGARNEYGEDGKLARVIDVNGEAIELVYDPDNSTEITKDLFGNPTTYVYDNRGNILTEIDPVGKVTKRTYDINNNVETETIITDESGAEGWTTTYTYDSQDNMTSVTDRLEQTIRYTYNEQGDVLSVTDPLGNTTSYTYDGQRNLTSLTDAAGNTTEYGYNSQGNITSVIDANGESSYLKYDALGNLIETEDALGNKVTFSYDDNNQLSKKTETVTTSDGLQEIIYGWNYNLEGQITSIVDPQGNSTQYEYDANGNRLTQTDALLNQTKFVYNDNNLLVETIYPDQTPENVTDNPRIIHLYDRGNRRRATINQSGQVTHYNYNSMGWLVETIYPDATDNISLLISEIAPGKTLETINWAEVIYPDLIPEYLEDNPRVSTEYYQNGWVKADVDERGYRIEYRYNDRGELIEEIYPDKTPEDISDNPRTIRTYNAEGDLISTTNALGDTTQYKYDELNRLIETHFPDGTFTSITYDALDRRTSFTDQAGNTTQYRYDSNGQLTGVRDTLDNWTEYGYDELGRLIWLEDANERRTYYEYNGIDQRTAVILPNQQRSESTYNAIGLIESFTDFNQQTTTFAYDAQNRLINETFADDTVVNYTYNPTNDLATVTDSRGTTTYEYDERNRLIARQDPEGIYLENGSTIEYDYDAASNITSISTPGGTTTYTYDERNRLETTSDLSQGTTRYFYDNFSNLVQTELPNGVIEARQYDKLNRLTYLENTLGDTTLSSYDYTLDLVGNRVSTLEHNGRLVEYEYDDLYRLTQEKITDLSDLINDGRIISYTYDNVGNRLTLDDSFKGITSYEYNQNDWLLSETLNKDGQTIFIYEYDYDNNGNTISRIKDGTEETTYQWNPENRLIAVELSDGTQVDYTYDANGNRVSSAVNGEITNYIVDTNQLNSEVIEEYIDGTLDTRYIYGIDLISQERADKVSVYLSDALGSVRILTDEDGNITDTYTYDAFGELIISTGETNNSYRYAGEQYDENLDGYYLRQRYYNPSIGRFVSQDPFEGILSDPQTLHNFAYVHNNPVMNVDPSGLLLFAWQAALVNIGILSATSTGVSLTALGVGTIVTGLLTIGAVSHTIVAISRGNDGKVVGDDYVFIPKVEADGHNRVFPSEEIEKQWNNRKPKKKGKREFNEMRFQVQSTDGKVEESVTALNFPDPGVLFRQIEVAGVQLDLMAKSGSITNLPKKHNRNTSAAIGLVVKRAGEISQSGGIDKPSSTVYTAQWTQPKGKIFTGVNRSAVKEQGDYRVELENLIGHNLRG